MRVHDCLQPLGLGLDIDAHLRDEDAVDVQALMGQADLGQEIPTGNDLAVATAVAAVSQPQ